MPEINVHTFELSTKINPATDKPFGSKYAGEFKVRRPTIADTQKVALMDAGYLSFHNISQSSMVGDAIQNMNYIEAFFQVCAEKTPDWFDLGALYEEDRKAVVFAFQEVSQWLDTFRPEQAG